MINEDREGITVTVCVPITQPPKITWAGVPDGGWTNKVANTLTGSLNEPGTLTLNGAAVAIGEDLKFSVPITLTEGSNELVFVAIDRADNKTKIKISVNLDTHAPEITWKPRETQGHHTRLPVFHLALTAASRPPAKSAPSCGLLRHETQRVRR